jgi:predicted TIM-barrel fold metal-dependent hydrolase
VSFLNEFEDKLMFGTDICTKGNEYPTAQFLRDLQNSGEISAETFEKIARGNAARLMEI